MLPAKKIESNYFSHVPKNEWRKNRMEEKSRQREKKVRAILQEKAIVIDFEIK